MQKFLDKSNSIKINRIKIEGIWTLDHEFKEGLNVVITANNHGKTTLIHIILATLGFTDKRKDEAKKYASKAYVEFLLNGKLRTVKMDTKEKSKSFKTNLYIQDNVNIDKFNQEKSKMISRNNLNGLIENELGLNPYIYRDKVNNKQPLNNLNQSYRAFYLMQGKAYELISDYHVPDIRKTVTQSLLRSPNDSNVFEDKSIDYGSEIKEKKKAKDAITRYINKKQLKIKEYVSEIISDRKKIQEIDINKNDSIQEIINNVDSQINEIKESKIELRKKLNDIYDNVKIHKDVRTIEKSKTDLEHNKDNIFKESSILEQEINSTSKKILKYQEDLIEIDHKLDQRNYSIPLIIYNPADTCDRCGRKVPNSRLNWEKESPPKCALCGRKRDENFLKPEELKNRKKEIEDILQDLNITLNENETKNQDFLTMLSKIKKSIDEKKSEIEDLRKNLTGESTRNIFDESNALDDKQIEWNEKKINISDYAENLEELPKINKEISKLKKKKKEFDAKSKFKFEEDIKKDWERFIQDFMIKVGFEDEGDKIIKLDAKTMLPTIDGKSWKKGLGENEKHLYNLAMYLAFLKCSINHSIKYPRFVLWDCWRTGELDKGKAKRVGEVLSDLHNEHVNNFQMIVFTADETIEGYIPPENILKREFTKEKEEYLFLENGVIKSSYPKQEK